MNEIRRSLHQAVVQEKTAQDDTLREMNLDAKVSKVIIVIPRFSLILTKTPKEKPQDTQLRKKNRLIYYRK